MSEIIPVQTKVNHLRGGAIEYMEDFECALVDLCKGFLAYLLRLKESGLISEAEYEIHSSKKIQFIDLFNNE